MRNSFLAVLFAYMFCYSSAYSQTSGSGGDERHMEISRRMLAYGLETCEAYDMLEELTSLAGSRLSGSPGSLVAIDLTRKMMESRGFHNVHLEPVMVPHWVRGPIEEATIMQTSRRLAIPLNICALGGSIATPSGGIEAEVLEVHSFEELKKMSAVGQGKIIFFNRPMDRSKFETFEAYGNAVNQRSTGAIEAARVGGVAVLVRSMTLALDDVPHTGWMRYADTVNQIPAAALSTLDANILSDLLKREKNVRVRMTLTCQTLPDAESANVVGELTGTEKPNEVIVVAGHLDSWDKGTGAHDDGAGCVQAIEVLNLLKKAGVKPKRTIRAVMFMNEENGQRGAKAYPIAPQREGEVHVAAIESDRGGFAPRGISVHGDSTLLQKVLRWKPLFEQLYAGRIVSGGSGVDVAPLVERGVAGFGLIVENHRYFDYHHSANDTLDKVNPRELEMGAIVEAMLCYLISEEGL